jgi:hypothetical protein
MYRLKIQFFFYDTRTQSNLQLYNNLININKNISYHAKKIKQQLTDMMDSDGTFL